MRGYFQVRFLPEGLTSEVLPGASVLDAALLAGAAVYAPCGGEGRCGKCRVRVRGACEPPTEEEREHLGGLLEKGYRLACQAVLSGESTIETGAESNLAEAKATLLSRAEYDVDLPLDGPVSRAPLGAALDVGTTTLCASLIDLQSGRRLGVAACENPQASFGSDVMTRIDKCSSDAGALSAMKEAVVGALNRLLRRMASAGGRPTSDIGRLVMVGNTTMLHLAMGLDPSPLGRCPFQPAGKDPVNMEAAAIGLEASPDALLLAPPVISGFLGADILAGILATDLHGSHGARMVVDLGTNGEIALGDRGRLAACSTAAGPAFEGALISCGMRAEPGAVEALSRDGNLTPLVLGGGRPSGICGSGLLDAAAALLDSGLLQRTGRLVSPGDIPERAPGRIREEGGIREFLLDPDSRLTLSQKDFRELQLAKGAVRAGIEVLRRYLGLEYSAIETIFLAGAFGSLLRPASAVRVGLLPRELHGRIFAAGNAALTGAEMILTSVRRWNRAVEISRSCEVVELAGSEAFEREFLAWIPFPAG